MIKNCLIFIIVMLYSLPVFSMDLVKQTPATKKCYDIVVTGYVTSCMADLANTKKKEYNKVYNSFIDKIKSDREDYLNYNNYIKRIRNAKIFYDKYIENECASYADIYIENSPAYYTLYYHCKVTLYNDRVNFYKDYRN